MSHICKHHKKQIISALFCVLFPFIALLLIVLYISRSLFSLLQTNFYRNTMAADNSKPVKRIMSTISKHSEEAEDDEICSGNLWKINDARVGREHFFESSTISCVLNTNEWWRAYVYYAAIFFGWRILSIRENNELKEKRTKVFKKKQSSRCRHNWEVKNDLNDHIQTFLSFFCVYFFLQITILVTHTQCIQVFVCFSIHLEWTLVLSGKTAIFKRFCVKEEKIR